MMGVALLVGVFALSFLNASSAQSAVTILSGEPTIIKISEGGTERVAEPIGLSQGRALRCVISQVGSFYYWASRNNLQLARIDGPVFVTYVAMNGSGYIRVLKPDARAAAALISPTEAQFDYVEHMLVGPLSVTYYGFDRP